MSKQHMLKRWRPHRDIDLFPQTRQTAGVGAQHSRGQPSEAETAIVRVLQKMIGGLFPNPQGVQTFVF
jgi:hypothetical protein